ncbi:MAG: TlpA disulfide reductase family protein [Bacteroidales bacterium]|nr:TlpA disulfide reductase family protein [Bacteroidales bacterium]MDD4672422.1 TlpA disulfide reductase family protein [Bacteroidales bacterium]MDY0347304.1 TlpA disulfide reductase family protein [Tenuifilaceae bacterium]
MAFFRRVTLLTLIVLSFTTLSNAQVKLSGNAPSYAGEVLTFCRYSDYITRTEEVLSKCTVDKSGNFNCDIKVNETTFIFSQLGIYYAYLFIEPGKKYEIVLPKHEPKTEAQRLNPYFVKTNLHIGIKNMQPNDLNYLISTFDLTFNEQFNIIVKNAYEGKKMESLDSLKNELEAIFKEYNNPFFNSYRTYRYGLLSQIALMQQSRSISSVYFQNKPIRYNNPAYMELFNLLYDKYFLFFARSNEGNAALTKVTNQRSYQQLNRTLSQDDLLKNDSLRELVILKGLHDGFFDDRFSRGALLTILDSLYSQTIIAENLMIAENIRQKVTRLLPGFVPSPFELYTVNDELVSLSKFEGKYVYLNFCTTTSYSCLQEFPLLEKIYEKYKDKLEIVTIAVDTDINDLKHFLGQNKYKWTFLHYGNKPDIVKDFDIRAYPTYFLVGPDKRLVISPAQSPNENFEQLFFKLLRSKGEI